MNLTAAGSVISNRLIPTFEPPKFIRAFVAVEAPVPPFAMAKSVPLQSSLFMARVPPRTKLPVEVTVPVNVIPFTDPVPLTEVTPTDKLST